ncbi:helix-turn-helix domain-containing protein [uncultured Formosa sp.]|uniref:helix-turn-helix domain-containing protein n=1 Tax=uncultured Formosa sp. TaxID=255435 RepID=UPI00261DFED6|nr:helix-turn-helix domain-containing protein [uncultured Formosa sp.]
MGVRIITTDDLRDFKIELLEELKVLLARDGEYKSKKWLKSPEVRELLGISHGTLQNLRVNGTLPYSKVGGVLYYDYQDIIQVIEANKIHNTY